jgi:tetratricopeptide (TPR) repeat protein
VLTELAECYACQGRYRRAIACCREVLAADPYREAVYVRLMLYQYYAGEQTQALRTYERCRQALADELGVEPLPATTTLAEQIRGGTLWASEGAPRYPPPKYEGRLFEVPYSLGHTPFVGREREYSWLTKAGVILIEGEAGVGKSRLVDEFLGYAAAEGAVVLRSQAAPGEGLPYAPVVAALRPLLEPGDKENVSPTTLAALAPLFPQVRERHPDLPSLPELMAQQERERLFEAVVALVQARAPVETLLLVDDVHRAGMASLDLLIHLAGILTIVLTCRTEETPPDHPLRVALRPLRQEGRLSDLTLDRLSPEAVQALIRQLAHGDLPALAEPVIASTGGNPLFVVALLQHMFEEGALYVDAEGYWAATGDVAVSLPPTVRETIEARLHRLSGDPRRVFDLVAVVGGEFDFALLQHASRVEEAPLLNALDGLLEAGLLVEPRAVGRAEFAPAHDCYAEVAYDTLPLVCRRRLHRRVAEALVALHGDDPATSAGLAYHCHRGDQPAEAVRFATQAGEHALRLYAGQQAAGHFGDAVKWAEAAGLSLNDVRLAEIYLNWGEALRRSGRYDEAMTHFVQALPLAQGELKLAVAHQICSVEAMRGGSVAEFSRLAPSLEQELADAGDTWALVALRWTQGFMAAMQGEVARARACSAAGWCVARRLVARGDEAPVWLEPRGYIGLARCHEWWADWRRAIRYANKALALDTAHNDLNGIAASHATLGTARYSLGEWDQALRHFERCYSLAADAGDPRMQGVALYRAGLTYFERGDWATAEEHARRVLATAESIGDALRQGFGQSLLARLSMRRGAPQEAIPVLQLQERMARAADAAAYVAQMLRHLAEAHLLAGDLEAALSTAREGSELAERCGMKREWGGSLRILGEALAQSGELLEAERHLLRAIALAKRIGCRYDLAEAHRSLGRLYRERGAAEAARKHVGVALTLFEDLGAEHDAAKTRRLLSDFARA